MRSGRGKQPDESRRFSKPFVPVEYSSQSNSLFESRLFSHKKEAFTGANMRKIGLVEAVHGGTLFLDELGDIRPALQVKLLRLLESLTYRKVGSVEARQADFRLICATQKNIAKLVESSAFRKDLFYRINPFPIELLPLRNRRADIPLLTEALLEQLAGTSRPRVNPGALKLLQDYDYPGNIRELRNILERAVLLTDGNSITAEVLPEVLRNVNAIKKVGHVFPTDEIIPLGDLERRYLQQVCQKFDGDRKTLAEKLGVSESTLYRKLRTVHSNQQQVDVCKH